MFQLVVDVLLVCLVLFGFLAAVFWFRGKGGAAASAANSKEEGGHDAQNR